MSGGPQLRTAARRHRATGRPGSGEKVRKPPSSRGRRPCTGTPHPHDGGGAGKRLGGKRRGPAGSQPAIRRNPNGRLGRDSGKEQQGRRFNHDHRIGRRHLPLGEQGGGALVLRGGGVVAVDELVKLWRNGQEVQPDEEREREQGRQPLSERQTRFAGGACDLHYR